MIKFTIKITILEEKSIFLLKKSTILAKYAENVNILFICFRSMAQGLE
jgi:hypothetical protein